MGWGINNGEAVKRRAGWVALACFYGDGRRRLGAKGRMPAVIKRMRGGGGGGGERWRCCKEAGPQGCHGDKKMPPFQGVRIRAGASFPGAAGPREGEKRGSLPREA